MPLSRRRITDAESLRALAHPLRLELLELLVVEGAQTASQAAARLGQSPSNCSWHLRKLAEHGFVREVEGRSRPAGRSRPWRAVTEGLTWGDPSDDDQTTAAGEGLTDMLLERELQRFRAARAASAGEAPEWREATSLNQSKLWLTAEEAQRISEQMRELFLSYGDRMADPGGRPESARLVAVVGWLVPSGPPARADAER
jgi:DNA-binding transcriptional ArsR family regulator